MGGRWADQSFRCRCRMPFGRMRRIGNCPPRLRAGLGRSRRGAGHAGRINCGETAGLYAGRALSAPAEPGPSAVRQGRRINGDGVDAAGGRGRGRRGQEFAINAVLLVHMIETRRIVHIGSFGIFLSRFLWHIRSGRTTLLLWPHHMAGTGFKITQTASFRDSRLRERASAVHSIGQRVWQYYTPFLLFVKFFCIEKSQMLFTTYYTAQQSRFTEAPPQR